MGATIVAASDHLPAYCVSGSIRESSRAFYEIPRILVESDWKYSFSHDVANCLVCECASIIFCQTPALLFRTSCTASVPWMATHRGQPLETPMGRKSHSHATFIFSPGVEGLISAEFSSER